MERARETSRRGWQSQIRRKHEMIALILFFGYHINVLENMDHV